MDITLLIKSILGLVSILAILLLILLFIPDTKKKEVKRKVKKADVKASVETDLESLVEIIRDKSSTKDELTEALDLILKYHGSIHAKLGIRTHPDFKIYSEIILRICRHPNTSKNIILKFDRELEAKNPSYKREINDALSKGLNSRGF